MRVETSRVWHALFLLYPETHRFDNLACRQGGLGGMKGNVECGMMKHQGGRQAAEGLGCKATPRDDGKLINPDDGGAGSNEARLNLHDMGRHDDSRFQVLPIGTFVSVTLALGPGLGLTLGIPSGGTEGGHTAALNFDPALQLD